MQHLGCGFGIRAAAAIFTSVLVGGCANLLASPVERVDLLATENGFYKVVTGSGLRTYLRRGSDTSRLTIYIEGDGAHWRHGLPPSDPTPRNPLALKLAIADANSGNASVAYVARLCQYLNPEELAGCAPNLWTDARFSTIAITATTQQIDALVRQTQTSEVTLIGYSGGGALAALVATQRQDVVCLMTVAAPLNTDAWVSMHKVTPLLNSLNPANTTAALGSLPQVHFQGRADRVVPTETTQLYQHNHPRARFEIVAGYDHECCWEETWATRIKNACR